MLGDGQAAEAGGSEEEDVGSLGETTRRSRRGRLPRRSWKRTAEEQARQAAEEKRKRTAEEQARQAAEEKRTAEEQARQAAEEKRKRTAEEQARQAAEEKRKRTAEEQARQAAEEKRKRAAEEQARQAAEEKRKRAAKLLAGRYELGELLGRGGMAEVRRAVDQRLGRSVAVKQLRADLAIDPHVPGAVPARSPVCGGAQPSDHRGRLRHRRGDRSA